MSTLIAWRTPEVTRAVQCSMERARDGNSGRLNLTLPEWDLKGSHRADSCVSGIQVLWIPDSGLSEWQSQSCFAATSRNAVLQRQRPTMRFGYLTTQHQPDAGAGGLGREKRHEEVPGV